MKLKLLKWTCMVVALALLAPACLRTFEDDMGISALPEGTPIMMRLDFSASDLIDLEVATKAEATPVDEERIHDLYVMIFCNGQGQGHVPGQKIYGRYFSYEHLKADLATLDSSPNEGWWVENRTIDGSVPKTHGAVKISTKVCTDAKVVVIANINNGICKLGDSDGFDEDMLDYLNGIHYWSELEATQVKLTQDVVNRKDLFLMLGQPLDGNGDPKTVDTGRMVWDNSSHDPDHDEVQVLLKPVDAKVKFKIRINDPAITAEHGEYISAAKAVYWEVDNAPDRCFLFSDANGGNAPEGTVYFSTEPAYFEGEVDDEGGHWYVFSFYMLESRFASKAHADSYYKREKQSKTPTAQTGYRGDPNEHYVENGEWLYAMPYAPYVKFDMILTLTPAGVLALGGSVEHALTSDTIYTIHLGDFSNSPLAFDDYNTLRSTCYTYEITIANSGSIFAEVKQDNEKQPGQEGYLLLTDDEIVNADCHYEYHSVTFTYDPQTKPDKFSWYVKTPFTSKVGGGPQKDTKKIMGTDPETGATIEIDTGYPIYLPYDAENGTLLDYRWVKFAVNKPDNTYGYSTNRVAYPGEDAYDEDWGVGEHGPWDGTPHPDLMDISQLIQYIFQETDKESVGSSDFRTDYSITDANNNHPKVIRATVFIDEYYYEHDPRDESDDPQPDPNLWRQFVNAQPREMHILSKTVQSRDRKSDVIESSHSVIQQSIQTIYNVYEPTVRSLWGCEHVDEIKQSNDPNWKYWPDGCSESARAGANSEIGRENGRLNSAYIWGLYSRKDNNGTFTSRDWRHFLKYEVDNIVPELRNDEDHDSDWDDLEGDVHKYRGMAWSCLTRNRDNNGNHQIDEDEVRWYLAASDQLAGIWLGNESLSTSARLYQPAAGQWRAHVVSSTNKWVSWAEEGGGATDIKYDFPPSGGPSTEYKTWASEELAAVGQSVRCIRNIGTYDDNGHVTDISKAPVTVIPDKYFTVEKFNSSGVKYEEQGAASTYTDPGDYFVVYFDRLNTNSIREYSPGELPYHDQMSMNNRVYKKMVTQSLNQDVSHDKFKVGEEDMTEEQLAASSNYVLWKDINNNVTQAGTNKYCPAGYRFPNHTEWLIMSLYLPEVYLKKDKNGEDYSNTGGNPTVMPSRTFYDRGYYGSLRDARWESEYNKVGWIFSNKMHCSPWNLKVTHSRCVKDEDQTGIISGKIAVEGNMIYPGDEIPIDFKFSSTASTFTDATLTLWYEKNGFRTPYDLTSQLKTPTGLQYKGTQTITMPTLAQLYPNNPAATADAEGFNGSGIDMSIEVQFTNLNGRTGGHELAVKMKNPLRCELTPEALFYPNDGEGGRFDYSFVSDSHTEDLSSVSVTLSYTDQAGAARTVPISSISPSGKRVSGTKIVDMPALNDLYLDQRGFNLDWPMTLQATLTGTKGTTATSDPYPVSLVSHLAGSSFQFPTEYDATDGIPVNVVVESINDHASVSSASFYWSTDGSSYTQGAPLSGAGTSSMSTSTFVKDIIGSAVTQGSKYYFYLVAESSDGTSIRSDVWSMDVLYYGKNWNPGPWIEGTHKAGDIKNKWPVQSVTGLDFSAGDYLDAFIDVTNCPYIYYDGSSGNDIGMDNLITIGTSANLDWKNGDIYFYYPSHSPAEAPGEDRLQVSIKDNHNKVTRLRPYDLSGSITVRLSKDLLLVNGAELDYSQVMSGNNSSGSNSVTYSRETVSYITNQSTIKIGSVEGAHRSRATYNYVRVVRNEGPLE